MTINISWIFYLGIVLYCFLASAGASMTFGPNPYIDLGLGIIAVLLISKDNYTHNFNKVYGAFFLAIAAMYTIIQGTLIGMAAQVGLILIPLQLLFLKKDIQIKIFEILSKLFAILLILSLIWWILWLFKIPLPHFSQTLTTETNEYGFRFDNYILFGNTTSLNPYIDTIEYFRFRGFFLEPGHIGTVCSIFLFINRFNFKNWKNIVFFSAILLSISAAAYIITALGYIFYLIDERNYKQLLLFLFLIIIFVLFVNIISENNVFKDLIIDKLNRERGAIDSRFSIETNKLFNESMNNGNIIFGLGNNLKLYESAGYKVFLLQNGVVGSLLVLLAYFFILRDNYSRYGLFLFILYIVSFIQRVYCFWDAFLDPYILGLTVIYYGYKEFF